MDCKKMTFVLHNPNGSGTTEGGGSSTTEGGGSNTDQTGGEGQGSESGSDGNMG